MSDVIGRVCALSCFFIPFFAAMYYIARESKRAADYYCDLPNTQLVFDPGPEYSPPHKLAKSVQEIIDSGLKYLTTPTVHNPSDTPRKVSPFLVFTDGDGQVVVYLAITNNLPLCVLESYFRDKAFLLTQYRTSLLHYLFRPLVSSQRLRLQQTSDNLLKALQKHRETLRKMVSDHGEPVIISDVEDLRIWETFEIPFAWEALGTRLKNRFLISSLLLGILGVIGLASLLTVEPVPDTFNLISFAFMVTFFLGHLVTAVYILWQYFRLLQVHSNGVATS